MFTLVSLKMQHSNFVLLLIFLKIFDSLKYHYCLEKIWNWCC